MAFESIDMSGPISTEGFEPRIDFHEWLGLDAIEASLGIDARLHEAGFTKHAQVLGNRGLRQPKLFLDVTHGLLGRRQQTQNGAATWLGDDAES